MRFQDAVQFIRNEHTNVSKPGLERINGCLRLLKHPEASQNIIHVVGTNGKGSTATMITNILVAAGYHVGTMLSPALHGVTDYFRLDGKPITDAQFVSAVETLKSALRGVDPAAAPGMDEIDPTEFEMAVCVALILFKMENCDFTVLEAGMGGANDATNVGQGCLTVVTKIGMDHTQYLGNAIEMITREKLGIASQHEPIVMAVNSAVVTAAAEQWCKENRHMLYTASIADEAFFPQDRAMIADYQKNNIATAQKAIEVLCTRQGGIVPLVDDFAIEAGIRSAKLAYRFDVRKTDPYLIFDGGHNPDGIDALCRSLQAFSGDTKYYVVTGVMADKDYSAMYEMLQQFAIGFVCMTAPNHRALPAADLAEVLRPFEKPVETVNSTVEAVERIKELRSQGYPVLVTGSLYIMADIVAAWNKA
ncbi:MAG: hypothetical protein IKX54_02900 [Lachnospiraceae bacterium]|nr:hypothetical protein [Lachnospiraceae bacterium]